jgi:hypothetical protein
VKRLTLCLLCALMTPLSGTARGAEPASLMAEAQGHFKRGVELYDDGDFAAALVEFRRAYELVPNHRVLYNLGRVASAQHDYAAALRFYRQYLADGGTQVPAPRRQEVEGELEKLVGRVGQLRVVVDTAGAEVSVDDVPAGISPLPDAVLVNAGRRRVVVAAPGVPPEARVVEVAGEEMVTVTLALHVARAAPPRLVARPEPRPLVEARPRATPSAADRRTWPIVLAWTTTGLLAAGSAVTGLMAMTASRDLRALRDSYPVSLDELTDARRKTRDRALVADGLLAAAAVSGALSLYLSLSGPAESTVFLGPGSVQLAGRF